MGLLKLFCRLGLVQTLPSYFLGFLLALFALSNTNAHAAHEQPGSGDMDPVSLQ